MTYLEQCNKYFAPLDEIGEAIRNGEGVRGLTPVELKHNVLLNSELVADLAACEDIVLS